MLSKVQRTLWACPPSRVAEMHVLVNSRSLLWILRDILRGQMGSSVSPFLVGKPTRLFSPCSMMGRPALRPVGVHRGTLALILISGGQSEFGCRDGAPETGRPTKGRNVLSLALEARGPAAGLARAWGEAFQVGDGRPPVVSSTGRHSALEGWLGGSPLRVQISLLEAPPPRPVYLPRLRLQVLSCGVWAFNLGM